MKTITQVFKEAKAELEEAGIDTPVTDSRLLLQHALGITHEELLMNPKRIVEDSYLKSLKRFIDRRKGREPVSRIVGSRAFWKSEFKISPETLDPRHDSETLIELALKQETPATLLDLGTGTGCLLLSLLKEWPEAIGVGVDISAGAVAIARENAQALGLAARASFMVSDWKDFQPTVPFDMVISNPPYISEAEMSALEPEVVNFDPRQALVAGADGLDAYRVIIALLPRLLKKGGLVLFEIGHTQAKYVKELLAESGLLVIQTVQDLGGNDRVVLAKNP